MDRMSGSGYSTPMAMMGVSMVSVTVVMAVVVVIMIVMVMVVVSVAMVSAGATTGRFDDNTMGRSIVYILGDNVPYTSYCCADDVVSAGTYGS